MDHQSRRYVMSAERRVSEQKWLELQLEKIRKLRRRSEVLESQIQQIARHINFKF